MAYEPRRTLLLGLSALAVVFAAALFPAAGVGTHPAGPLGGPGAVDEPTAAPTTPTPPATATPDATKETPAETPTEPPTETPGAGTNDGVGDVWPDLDHSALAAALEAAGWLLLAGLLAALALLFRGAEPGTPRVALPLGATVTLPFAVPRWVGFLSTPLAWLTMAVGSVAVLLSAFGAWAAAVLVAIPVAGMLTVFAAADPGTPRVTLPFGLRLTLPFDAPAWAGGATTGVSRLTMAFVVSASASVSQLVGALGAAGRAVVGGLAIALGEGIRGPRRLLAALPAALGGLLTGITALPGALLSLPGAVSTLGGSLVGGEGRPGKDHRELAPDPPETGASAGDAEEGGPPGVEDAWVAMVDLLPLERGPSTTPAEFARTAVDRGVPARPVVRLTRAFEDVVYGGYEPGERAAAAREALGRLRDRLGGGP